MPDRETVIKGLECCAGQCNYHGCPYKDPCENANGVKQITLDALALLKEQETADTGGCRVFQCKECGFGIDDIFVNDEEKYQIVPRYCPCCGSKVKRDE